MNWQRKIAVAALLTISLIGGDSYFSLAAAASDYPLWVCRGDTAAGVGADLQTRSAE